MCILIWVFVCRFIVKVHLDDYLYYWIVISYLPVYVFILFVLFIYSSQGREGVEARKVFVNAQWAFGGAGTGAPVHYHNTAWNAVVYGAKKWIIYPPHHQIMSNRQILYYIETDVDMFKNRPLDQGFTHKSCVQTAGDVMIIPESWGHGVLNIQESVAVATEAKSSHYRVRPGTSLLNYLPDDNRPRKSVAKENVVRERLQRIHKQQHKS